MSLVLIVSVPDNECAATELKDTQSSLADLR